MVWVVMLNNGSNTNSLVDSAGSHASASTNSGATGGKVKHDARGNAVWQWGVATGVFARIKSTELLSMLDNPSLALETEGVVPEWAGDPYNRR